MLLLRQLSEGRLETAQALVQSADQTTSPLRSAQHSAESAESY